MPSLSNISSFGGSTLNIKSLDCVDVAANTVACDSLVINGETITIDPTTVSDVQNKTQNQTATAGYTSFSGSTTVDTLAGNSLAATTGIINTLAVDNITSYVNTKINIDSGVVVIDTTNNYVGVNQSSPTQPLHVTGNILASGSVTGSSLVGTITTPSQTSITSVGTLSSLTVTGSLTVDTNTLKIDPTNNRVGIVTTTPTQALDVTGNILASGSVTSASMTVDSRRITGVGSGGYGANIVPGPDAFHKFNWDNTDSTGIRIVFSGYRCNNAVHNPYFSFSSSFSGGGQTFSLQGGGSNLAWTENIKVMGGNLTANIPIFGWLELRLISGYTYNVTGNVHTASSVYNSIISGVINLNTNASVEVSFNTSVATVWDTGYVAVLNWISL